MIIPQEHATIGYDEPDEEQVAQEHEVLATYVSIGKAEDCGKKIKPTPSHWTLCAASTEGFTPE
eukprot:6320528-Amphidinium_carterae.1